MKKTTEISPGLLLYTTDRLGANRAVSSIEYELEVRKDKLVVFEIDFTGSTNLALVDPTSSFKKKTTVEPHSKALVAVINVVDPNKSWSLETKYTWTEENPGTVQPGKSKRELLSEGIILTTSRTSSPETFIFHLSIEKKCSGNNNIRLLEKCEPFYVC